MCILCTRNIYLALVNLAAGLYGRILTKVVFVLTNLVVPSCSYMINVIYYAYFEQSKVILPVSI